MGATPTFRRSGSAAVAGTGSWSSGANFTPSDNSLLAIFLGIVDNGGGNIAANLTIADSGPGLTYTPRLTLGQAGGNSAQMRIWTAPVATGAAMSLTFDCGASNVLSSAWYVWDVTGYSVANPVGGSGSILTTADGPYSTASITLSPGPTPIDCTLAAAMIDGNTSGTYSSSQSTGFTKETDISDTTAACAAAGQRRVNSSTVEAGWDVDLDTGSMNLFSYAIGALVINGTVISDDGYPKLCRRRI